MTAMRWTAVVAGLYAAWRLCAVSGPLSGSEGMTGFNPNPTFVTAPPGEPGRQISGIDRGGLSASIDPKTIGVAYLDCA